MSDLEQLKQHISGLSEDERWNVREWLDVHTVDLDATPELRELVQIATDVLGEERRARRWLQSPNLALGDKVPAIVARRSQEDFCEIRDLLGRIRFGSLA